MKKKDMNVPYIRFSEFTEDWTSHRFKDITKPSGKRNKNGLRLEPYAVTNDRGFIPQSEAHDEFGYMQNVDQTAYIIVPPNSFAYNPARINVGSIGYYSGEKDVIVSSLYEVFKTTDEVDDAFLNQWIQTKTFRDWIYKLQEGSVRLYFYYDKLCEVSLICPRLEEQQKIADFLSSVDEVITASEEEVANLETQKKAVMKKIFSQEVRFKKDDGMEFPDWEEKAIREFAQCVAGATPSTKVEDYWENGTIPWMSSGEVNKGLIFDTNAKITQLGYDNTSTKMVPAETVVMALAGQGKTRGMVALTKIELCTNQSLCSIISDSSVYSAYLYQYLITQYQNLRQVSSGDGTRGGLNLQLVGDYLVLIPCLEEQHLIADFLSDFDEVIAAAKKELELWKELKKGLLQQMFV